MKSFTLVEVMLVFLIGVLFHALALQRELIALVSLCNSFFPNSKELDCLKVAMYGMK